MAAKISALPQSDADFREFIRDFFGNSVLCDLDSQGRVLIPTNLREYAHINKDLVTVGAMNKVEIWSAESKGTNETSEMMKNKRSLSRNLILLILFDIHLFIFSASYLVSNPVY